MNSLEHFNQRSDEVEHILSAGRGNVKSLYDPQRPTLYEIQQQNADDVRKLLERYEVDLKEQAKENKKNRKLTIISVIAGVVAAVFGGASFVVALITLLLQLS
jgi:hypothetical protein